MGERSAAEAFALDNELVIGIDLGTTNSCVGIWDWRTEMVSICPTDQGDRTVPSVVCFHKGDVLVGAAAKRKLASNPTNTIYNAKRVIGRPFSKIRQDDIEGWTFGMIGTDDNRPRYTVAVEGAETLISPEEIGALLLCHLKEMAEKHVGREVTKVVITVPAYFTDPQRRATHDAGLLAGLDVIRLLPEPTAAALAFGLDRKSIQAAEDTYVLVFDMGGGTFDVSILMLDGRGSFVTKAVTGDFHLGGEDFDDRLLQWLLRHPKIPEAYRASVPPKTRQKLRKLMEAAKRELSTSTETVLDVELGGEELEIELTREVFENLCADLFDNAMREVSEALELAEIAKERIDSIVLVGGSTRIPRLQEMLQSYFNGKKLWCGVNPDEAIAWGATALAGSLVFGSQTTRGATAPAVEASKPSAAIPLGHLNLTSITPITLGILLSDGTMDVLIPRGSKIPASRSDDYTTCQDGQKSVVIKVFEGECTSNATDNYLLGKFSLPVEIAKARVPRVKVTFEITADGLFLVTACNLKNGEEVTVTLENTNLTANEKENIVASVGSERSHFRSYISQTYGAAAKIGDKELVTQCTLALQWLQSYPEASKTEITSQHSALQQEVRRRGLVM